MGFALGHVARLERAGRLDDRELLDRLDGAVAVRAKSHARRAVTLVGRVLDRSPALASAAAPILAHALGHAAAEVQEAALTILERHPDAVGELSAETVDPSLRRRTLALVGEVPSTAAERVQVPPLRLPDPLGNDRIVPVEDVEELLDLAARLLEDDRDPDEFERLVDGVSRLCDVPVDEGRRTALLRRAKPRSSADCVEPLVQHWLAPDARSSAGWSGPADAVGRRLNALIARLDARRPALWLSAPTHRGGYIDPAVLADRLARADAIEDYDLAQALLRVPALQPLAGVGGEPGELIRAALAGEVRVPEAPALAASWDTAAVLAKPEALELAGPSEDAWEGVVHDLRAAPLSPARLLVAYASPYSEAALEGVAMQRRLSFVWPAQREVYFKTVWSAAWSSYGDPWGWGIVKFSHRLTAALEVMLDRGERLEPHALGLLAIGAQAPDENRLLATEVLIEAIEARRLPHTHFGRALAGTLDWPSAVPKRWADALEPVAGAGPLHAHEVRVVLEALFAALGERRPQLPGVIDLFRRLVVEQGAPVESEAARTWLGALSASSKSGKAARAALAVS